MARKLRYAIVIPAFNEEKRLGAVLRDLAEGGMKVYVVDDGSEDKTSEVARKYKVEVVRLEANSGKGKAMRTGADLAFENKAEAVIFLDADGQHKAEELGYFTDAIEVGKNEVVFGSRNLSMGVPLVRYLGNKAISVTVNLLFGIYISDLLCGYRAVTKGAYKKIRWESDGYGVETEMAIKVGIKKLRYCEVPVQVVYFDSFKGLTWWDGLKILADIIRWKMRGW